MEREPSVLTSEGVPAAHDPGGDLPPPSAVGAPPDPAGAGAPGAQPREIAGPTVYVAGFWRRTAGALLDGVVVLACAWLPVKLLAWAAGMTLPPNRHAGPDTWLDLALAGDAALWGRVALFATFATIYLVLFQVIAGRTLGMRALGLRVIDPYGDPPTLPRVLVRTLGYALSLATGGLGFLWVAFDREKRGLHDWLAGTYVTTLAPARGTSTR